METNKPIKIKRKDLKKKYANLKAKDKQIGS